MFVPARPNANDSTQNRWFEEAVRTHEPALRAFLHSHFASLSDADDIVQEAYVRVLRARARGASFPNAKSFLFTTARNLAIDWCRHRRVIPLESLGRTEHLAVQEEQPHAAEAASRAQELELLAQAIQSLPPRCQQILRLRRLRGLSHRQIAAQLDISERTVNAQLAIAIERLRDALLASGLLRDTVSPLKGAT